MSSGSSSNSGLGNESAAMLEVRNLALSRNGRAICKQLSFTLEKGDIIELSGANGAGKTTLLRTLAGLSETDQGRVLWRGLGLREAHWQYLSELTYIGHKSGMKPALSVRENLRFYLGLKSSSHEPLIHEGAKPMAESVDGRMDKALARLDLTDYADVPCSTLSEGQRRRAALARLPLERATLWLLDEPAATLDSAGIAALTALLAEHGQRGGVAVVATHQPLQGMGRRLELPYIAMQ